MSTHAITHDAHAARDGGDPAEPGGTVPVGSSRLDRLRDVVITLVGVVGIATIAWLLAAWIWGLSIVVFVTGSMSPTMPVGTAAVSQLTPAAELRVGDVVTVPRPDTGQPVTHRIVAIDEVAAAPEERELTLRGDDNGFADSQTYLVDQAPRVLVAVPVLGSVVLWAQTPIVMIAASILIALAIAWALWPTPTRADADADVDVDVDET
ncbi:signal peptidase I [Microbacterium arborescens]|jgi:signal peptidase|uniref:signal peptidase I n=1 Tax=Microbacterium arborescens TaxID=33883 RepID=UPI0025A273AB|nr:signal peptidase I [Microbacterium arborescens]MDF2581156.1 signal peptidase [Microbacterium sp.]WJM16671.1 signal peptidase I [Microbacterium arborescens]